MTTQEFSTEFDILYNNVTSNQAPGLNEYEKSVFLTKAQSQLVSEYFNQRTDGVGGGYDGSEKRQYDFSSLVRTENLYNVNYFKNRIDVTEKLDRRSLVFLLPTNFFLAVNEILYDGHWQYSVLPIDYTEYQRLMLKPYSFPVKRGAWRLFTDKKNCNYVHEDADGKDLGNTPAPSDYSILSTWADQRRNLKIIIQNEGSWDTADNVESITYDGRKTIRFKSSFDPSKRCSKVYVDSGWERNGDTYKVRIYVNTDITDSNGDCDDETVLSIIKDGFLQYKNYVGSAWDSTDNDVVKGINHTDGFMQAEAPSKKSTFSGGGRTFETKVIQVPMAEIIGKFSGEVQYQMRYVRTLTPIILEDLNIDPDLVDLTIDGMWKKTECSLPKECHHEILERAVTLAKIAWQGGTATQAAAQQRQNNR